MPIRVTPVAVFASMGPSSRDDGNPIADGSPSYSLTGFNGAVVSRRRKPMQEPSDRPPKSPLQWGRRLATTETREPRSWLPRPHSRFNGAVVSRRRKPGSRRAVLARRRLASMGPSSRDDGNLLSTTQPGVVESLQWGRRLATTETRQVADDALTTALLQWGRRLATTETPCSEHCARPVPLCFNGAVVSRRRKPTTTKE